MKGESKAVKAARARQEAKFNATRINAVQQRRAPSHMQVLEDATAGETEAVEWLLH